MADETIFAPENGEQSFRLSNVTDPLQGTLAGLGGGNADLDLAAITAACKAVIPFLSELKGAFSFATGDLIKKVKEQEEMVAAGTTSVVAMIAAEKEAGTSKKKEAGTRILKRLYYMLWFVEQLIAHLGSGQEMSEALPKAYGDTMEKGHGWVVGKMARAAFSFAPKTQESIETAGETKKSVPAAALEFSKVILPHVQFLNALYESQGLGGNW